MAGKLERIVYVPFDHLNFDRGALKTADPLTDLVVLVESKRMTEGRPWHKCGRWGIPEPNDSVLQGLFL
jgi:deoxyribodipyrimidine photolyase-related protein